MRLSLIILLFLCSSRVYAARDEILGRLEVSEILLKPYFLLKESSQSEFLIGDTSFTMSWYKDDLISSRLKIGSADLINKPIHYEKNDIEDLKIVEAFAQIKGAYGEARLGLIPLDYGLEGATSEGELIFPRSLLFKYRIVGLRDYGASYKISDRGFYTRMAVHNGESDRNLDGRMWYTATWGYDGFKNLRLGMSGQTGSTKPAATSLSSDTLAGVDVNEEAKWRMAGLFAAWRPRYWTLSLEATSGDLLQNKVTRSFYVGHLDIAYDINETWGVQTRYDILDPNTKIKGDSQTEISLGAAYKSEHETSVIYLIATKILEETNQKANDEIRLIWRVTPFKSYEN